MNDMERLDMVLEMVRGTDLEPIVAIVALGAISGTCTAMSDVTASAEQERLLARIGRVVSDSFVVPELMLLQPVTGEA